MKSNNQVVVMISCMHEKDYSILDRTMIQSDAIVINQCDTDSVEIIDYSSISGQHYKVTYVNTTSRGLSKSRNMALPYVKDYDIALVCDDDEQLTPNYVKEIVEAYDVEPHADVIAFAIECDQYTRNYSKNFMKLGFREILRTSSQQITFKTHSILGNQIFFDEKMGSGTGNGAGEETKFLLTCRHKGMNMFYSPFVVSKIVKGESKWFSGYTPQFFINQGWTDRRLLGSFLGLIYLVYWAVFRRSEYKNDNISTISALWYSLKGYFTKR